MMHGLGNLLMDRLDLKTEIENKLRRIYILLCICKQAIDFLFKQRERNKEVYMMVLREIFADRLMFFEITLL